MRTFTALALAGLLSLPAAYAATHHPAAAAQPVAKTAHDAAQACRTQGREKQLRGEALDKFIKTCAAKKES